MSLQDKYCKDCIFTKSDFITAKNKSSIKINSKDKFKAAIDKLVGQEYYSFADSVQDLVINDSSRRYDVFKDPTKYDNEINIIAKRNYEIYKMMHSKFFSLGCNNAEAISITSLPTYGEESYIFNSFYFMRFYREITKSDKIYRNYWDKPESIDMPCYFLHNNIDFVNEITQFYNKIKGIDVVEKNLKPLDADQILRTILIEDQSLYNNFSLEEKNEFIQIFEKYSFTGTNWCGVFYSQVTKKFMLRPKKKYSKAKLWFKLGDVSPKLLDNEDIKQLQELENENKVRNLHRHEMGLDENKQQNEKYNDYNNMHIKTLFKELLSCKFVTVDRKNCFRIPRLTMVYDQTTTSFFYNGKFKKLKSKRSRSIRLSFIVINVDFLNNLLESINKILFSKLSEKWLRSFENLKSLVHAEIYGYINYTFQRSLADYLQTSLENSKNIIRKPENIIKLYEPKIKDILFCLPIILEMEEHELSESRLLAYNINLRQENNYMNAIFYLLLYVSEKRIVSVQNIFENIIAESSYNISRIQKFFSGNLKLNDLTKCSNVARAQNIMCFFMNNNKNPKDCFGRNNLMALLFQENCFYISDQLSSFTLLSNNEVFSARKINSEKNAIIPYVLQNWGKHLEFISEFFKLRFEKDDYGVNSYMYACKAGCIEYLTYFENEINILDLDIRQWGLLNYAISNGPEGIDMLEYVVKLYKKKKCWGENIPILQALKIPESVGSFKRCLFSIKYKNCVDEILSFLHLDFTFFYAFSF